MDSTTQRGTDGQTAPGACDAMAAQMVVAQYLSAFYTGDFDRAKAVVAPGFSFRGPFLQVQGRDAFFAGAQGLRPIVRGHQLLRQWVDGADVSSSCDVIFDTLSGTGRVPMSEWHTVHDGRLTSALVLFDAAAFRSLFPAP